jgi:hypothetical protein
VPAVLPGDLPRAVLRALSRPQSAQSGAAPRRQVHQRLASTAARRQPAAVRIADAHKDTLAVSVAPVALSVEIPQRAAISV